MGTSRGVFTDLTVSRFVCSKTDNRKEHSNKQLTTDSVNKLKACNSGHKATRYWGRSKVLSGRVLERDSRRLEGDQNKHPSLGGALANRSEFSEFPVPKLRFKTNSCTTGNLITRARNRYDILDRSPQGF